MTRPGRREFLTLLSLGVAATLAEGCSPQAAPPSSGAAPTAPTAGAPTAASPQALPTPFPHPEHTPGHAHAGGAPFPPPRPGPPTILRHAPERTQQIALTIDDGYDQDTVSAYVAFAQRTAIPITFSPNGLYAYAWQRHADTLRPLIEAGQVQIGNHTYDHTDLTRVSDARARAEIERNEEWIRATFGTTSRPYLRPPYGARDERTDELAGSVGFTSILLWNASFGDSRLLTPQVLLAQARRYLVPGAIVLGHANHPTVTHLYDQIVEIIRDRDLEPVTLDTMFGTSGRLTT